MTTLPGYLIAGGASSRMGRDKRRVLVHGVSLLERAVTLLESATGQPPVLVGDNYAGTDTSGLRILSDARPGSGPLGGLVAALRDTSGEWALVLAVDLPNLEARDLRALIEAERRELDVLTLSVDGRPEPLAALYRTAMRPFWSERLDLGELALYAGIRELRWATLPPVSGPGALRNVNRPGDLERP